MPERIIRGVRERTRGLGFKLFALVGSVLLVFFAVNTVMFQAAYSAQLERNVIVHAIQVSDLIKSSMRESMLKNHREDLAKSIRNIGQEEGVEGVWIYNKAGEVQFSNHEDDVYRVLDKKAEQCVFCHDTDEAKGTIPVENRYRYLRSVEGHRVLGLINPIDNEPSCANSGCHAHDAEETLLGLLDIQLSLKDVDASVASTWRWILLSSLLLVGVTGATFWGLIHFFVHRPITKLIEGTRQVAHMNLDTEIDVRSRDEIGDLAASFNRMTGELRRANRELQEWSGTLEEKVRQKTAALEKAQSNLILAEKMASLGKLSAMVAHEINNPLAGILTYAKVSLRRLEGGVLPEATGDVAENLGLIRDEAKRCGEIVKNMLLFSRRTGGQMAWHDLRAIVARSVGLVRHSFEVKNVSLAADLEAGDLEIRCDADGIQQLLLALLINALEAVTETPGRVSVEVRRLEGGDHVRLTVSDTGCGIPEAVRPHVFEPFFTTKETGKGTGLGLAVVYGVVERHGGCITVESEEHEGTTFTVDLPLDGGAVRPGHA